MVADSKFVIASLAVFWNFEVGKLPMETPIKIVNVSIEMVAGSKLVIVGWDSPTGDRLVEFGILKHFNGNANGNG